MYLCVCGTFSAMSGLASRSLGLHTLGTKYTPASSKSVHHSLALINTKQGVNVTCSRTLRKAHRSGFEPGPFGLKSYTLNTVPLRTSNIACMDKVAILVM